MRKSSSSSGENRGKQNVVAYEFFCLDEAGKGHLIGVLPERREDPKRITQESIMNWGRTIIGRDTNCSGLFFTQIIIADTSRTIKNTH